METSAPPPVTDMVSLPMPRGIFQRFTAVVEAFGERSAVSAGGIDLDYTGLYQRVIACAATLKRQGVVRADVVGLLLPNGLDFVVVTLAVMALDAILLPLNPRYTPEELQQYLTRNRPKVVFLPPPLRQTVEAMQLQAVLYETAPEPSAELEPPAVSPDAGTCPALYMFSSGSTGKSKRITRTQQQVIDEYYALRSTVSLQPSDCILCSVPLYHAHGFGNALMAALMTGGRLVIMTQEFSPRATLKAMESYGVTLYPGVPFMYKMMADTRFKTPLVLDPLRLLISAGAKLPEDTADGFYASFGKPISQLYGSTETGAICLNLKHPREKKASVGRPLTGMQVGIFDEAGSPLGPGMEGEIWIKSPAMTRRYDDLPEVTQECFVAGRFFAGDLGYLDPEGDLFVTGRKKLMINVAGYKVDPLEIEQVLKSHVAVEDAVVLGVTDSHYGELIKAVVVRAAGAACSEQELIGFVASRLAEYKTPKVVEFRAEIPYSPLGKVLRKYLE